MENYIPYSQTGYFSKLILDYLADVKAVRQFVQYDFSPDAFEGAISDRKNSFSPEQRQQLRNELEGQYSGFEISRAVQENISALAEENTFCIVTAHQLNIFSGPLYVLIKIANVISVCARLKERYPGYKFVPVYMLGSEDHDFDEIATVSLFGKTLTWQNRQPGPMGRYSTDGLQGLIGEVRQILGNMPFAEEWVNILETAYSNKTLAEATRYLVNSLFENEGIVCVDGDSATLKKRFAPAMKKELEEGFSYPLLQNTSKELEIAGYHAQLAGREINLFYMGNGVRERIVRTGSGYEVLNTDIRFSDAEILRELELHPVNFSPNAVLRPVYQQSILPALAYIGGGGELAYWMQLKEVFRAADVFYPMLILRTSLTLLSPQHSEKLGKLGLDGHQLFKDIEALKKEYLQRVEDGRDDQYRTHLEELLKALKKKAGEADPTLAGWAGAEGQKIRGIVEDIEKRIVKAQKAKHEQALSQIEKLKEQLFPGGELQERVANGGQWYAKYGPAFIRLLLELDPFKKEFALQGEPVQGK